MVRIQTSNVSIRKGSKIDVHSKFTTKIAIAIRYFIFTIADADIESLKSVHKLFDKYMDHMMLKFEQNRMVRTVKTL